MFLIGGEQKGSKEGEVGMEKAREEKKSEVKRARLLRTTVDAS